MKWLKKYREITEGWYNDAFPTSEIEEMANKRVSICASCPNNINNTCKLCGCFLSKKTKSPTSKCPDGKW